MKDYSLLDINKQEFLKNWTNTYLKELNNKVFSLYNYNNFFIPDFLKEEPNNPESPAITDYSQISYHHWYRVLDTDIEAEYNFLGAKAGFSVLSYARNENELDKPEGIIRQNEKYYTVVPSSWGSFYDLYVLNGTWYFTFDPQAEENLGRENLLYNIDNFNSRFFINQSNTEQVIDGSYGESVTAQENGQFNIVDKQGHLWTDIKGNPVMGFTMYRGGNEFGEEVVLDMKVLYSRVAKSNTAVYTIKDKSGDKVVPQGNHTYIVLI